MALSKKIFRCFVLLIFFLFGPAILVAWRVARLILLNSKEYTFKNFMKINKVAKELNHSKIKLFDFLTKGSLRVEYIKSIKRIDTNLLELDRNDWIRMFLSIAVILLQFIPLEYVKEIMKGHLKYLIMCMFLYAFTDLTRLLGTLNINIWLTTISILISLILFSPTWLILFDLVLKNMDFGLVIITALFCFLPSYYLTIIMLNTITNSLLRILVATLFIVIVGSYTLMIFGTYDLKIDGLIDQYFSNNFIEYAAVAIHYGLKQFSQEALANYNGKTIYHILQIAFGIYGGIVFASVTKLALSNLEKNK